MTPQKTELDGLMKIGFVTNLRDGAYLKELQDLLSDTEQEPTSREIRRRATDAQIILLNRHGYPTDKIGRTVSERTAQFKVFDTGWILSSGERVYGWFEKGEQGNFLGVKWGTMAKLRAYARYKVKTSRFFTMGDFCFDNIEECQILLNDIVQATIPESWKYKNKKSAIDFPILKSYLETIFMRLNKEKKIIWSADRKHIIFNTNLLDKFFHAMYIVADVEEAEGLELYFHPQRVEEGNLTTLIKYGFKDVKPEPPRFFDEVSEVVFNPAWSIEKSYDSLTHIIEQRIDRFPSDMQNRPSHLLAKKLDDAIDYAVTIAQRNYKYIVPIYYPKFDSISFLMPIFLDGTYTTSPDFALVLETDRENQIYRARTILDLETGYQDARLIAKPDESWLNPVTLR